MSLYIAQECMQNYIMQYGCCFFLCRYNINSSNNVSSWIWVQLMNPVNVLMYIVQHTFMGLTNTIALILG